MEVPRLTFEKMHEDGLAENSARIKLRVQAARAIQRARFGNSKTNSEMSLVEIKKFCKLGDQEELTLKQAMKKYNFSGRSLHRILKVARTIADLEGLDNITVKHLGEAVQYRPKSE